MDGHPNVGAPSTIDGCAGRGRWASVGAMTTEQRTQPHRRRAFSTTVVAGALIAASAACTAEPDAARWTPTEQVRTAYGPVQGRADGEVLRFDGIRYARAPTGDLRFAPPRPVGPWDGVLDATAAGPACPQVPVSELVGGEDCLRVNVTVPRTPTEEPRPVMVWLHGGGFEQGSAADYDPRRLAVEGDVVVVTVGYRLGALGFLALPGLEGGGTFGLADQLQALRFVRETARAFGGNPDNVTLFGQSAGGTSVCHHLTSPAARGLFRRAIVQSAIDCGGPVPDNAFGLPAGGTGRDAPYVPDRAIDAVEARGERTARRLGCPAPTAAALRCLRTLPVEKLLTANPDFARPAVGGPLVPEAPAARLDQVSVPVLAGHTRDESRFYAMLSVLLGTPFPAGSYQAAVTASFGGGARAILAEYPRPAYANDAEAWAAVYTDSTFACPQLAANDAMARATSVYAYEFADRTAPPPLPLLPGMPEPGAAHTGELPYLFEVATQPVDLEGNRIPLTRAQRDLAREMVRIWTTFARTGEAAVRWDGTGRSLVLGADGPQVGDVRREHRCDFWPG